MYEKGLQSIYEVIEQGQIGCCFDSDCSRSNGIIGLCKRSKHFNINCSDWE